MPERADHTIMDYIYNVQATTNPIGSLISLNDTWGWSCTVALSQSGAGSMYFQFSDFDGQSGIVIPNPTGSFDSNAATLTVTSGPLIWRLGKAYDATCNTAKWMRMYWIDNGSNAATRLYVSVTLKHQ